MNKYPLIIGILLVGVSLFSIGPVICDEIAYVFKTYCTTWEFFYTSLPVALGLFTVGIILIVLGLKSISMMSFTKSLGNRK